MRLVYHFFGNVALLMRAEPAKLCGAIRVECDVPDGSRLLLYSTDEKEKFEYEFQDGFCNVAAEVFAGGKKIFISVGDLLAIATPLREFRSGGEIYLIGEDFSIKEQQERIAQALIYVGDLAKQASRASKDALSLKRRVDQLYERANSGDIINF